MCSVYPVDYSFLVLQIHITSTGRCSVPIAATSTHSDPAVGRWAADSRSARRVAAAQEWRGLSGAARESERGGCSACPALGHYRTEDPSSLPQSQCADGCGGSHLYGKLLFVCQAGKVISMNFMSIYLRNSVDGESNPPRIHLCEGKDRSKNVGSHWPVK